MFESGSVPGYHAQAQRAIFAHAPIQPTDFILASNRVMARILIVGKGGFGDMFPLFAIARELHARGHAMTIAAERHHQAACDVIDVPLVAVDEPSVDAIQAGVAPSGAHWQPDALAAVRTLLAPHSLAREVDALRPLAAGADLLIGNQLAYAGAIVRRLLGKPWVYCAASPLALPSRLDPPRWPYLDAWQGRWPHRVGVQRAALILARCATRALMRPQARLQRRLGLKVRGHPRFEGMYGESLNLLASSPRLSPPQRDWPAGAVVTGFPWFEPSFLGGDEQASRIAAFAGAGPRPIVFAPGGGLRAHPGRFFEESVLAAERLGQRAIIVAAKKFHGAFAGSSNVLVTGYLPYARLFRYASVVVHSAGIGTLGWALRQGVPSLVVPAEWDQFDNAWRAQRAGVAQALPLGQYQAERIAEGIAGVQADCAMADRLATLSPQIAAEDGATVAADAIERLLRQT